MNMLCSVVFSSLWLLFFLSTVYTPVSRMCCQDDDKRAILFWNFVIANMNDGGKKEVGEREQTKNIYVIECAIVVMIRNAYTHALAHIHRL